jgi:hypothetical protein
MIIIGVKSSRNVRGREYSEDIDLDDRVIFKWILTIEAESVWCIHLAQVKLSVNSGFRIR